MSSPRPWYAGRLNRKRGARAPVDVVAVKGNDGWDVIENPRRLFPKVGQVELLGPPAVEGSPGEWLAFQVVEDGRPGARQPRVGAHRFLPRFADLHDLGSVDAARSLFTREGWAGANDPGHWAVRFVEDRFLWLHLDRGRDGRLRCAERSLDKIACLPFDDAKLLSEPAIEDPQLLYDAEDAAPLTFHDWSPGADYVAHVVRALAGANDPRLPELITWLELHRDDVTGRVSAIGADHELAFEALRSGELAARLSTDRDVMAAYFSAVRDDPQIAEAIAQAIAREAESAREDVRAALEQELAEEMQARRSKVAAEIAASQATAEADLQTRMAERERTAVADLDRRLEKRRKASEDELALERAATSDEVAAARAKAATLQEQRDAVNGEVLALRLEAAKHEGAARAAEERLASINAQIAAAAGRAAMIARPLAVVPTFDDKERIDRAELGRRISGCVLLTPVGKRLMADFAAYMMAGEVPVLDGSDVEDFVLVAEALLAAGHLVPFDADPTVITPEDLWSRPGSTVPSQVAQAASHADDGRTFLVHLRGIDRSAARVWHPALAALVRRGMLPRPLLLFATLIDPTAEEAEALSPSTCRMTIEDAVVDAAVLVAPSLLSGATSAIASHVDPGARPTDLSQVTAVLASLPGADLDVATAMRMARVAIEAAALAPDEADAMLAASQRFCLDVRCKHGDQEEQGERKNA